MTKCPSCKGEDLDFDPETTESGDSVECGDCGAQLTVEISRRIRLVVAEDDSEDEDDDQPRPAA